MKNWTVWAPALKQTQSRGQKKINGPTARAAARCWAASQEAGVIPAEGVRVWCLAERLSTFRPPPKPVSVLVHAPEEEIVAHG